MRKLIFAAMAAFMLALPVGWCKNVSCNGDGHHAFYTFQTEEGVMNIMFSEYPDGTNTVGATIIKRKEGSAEEILHYVATIGGDECAQRSARQAFRGVEFIYDWDDSGNVKSYDVSSDEVVIRDLGNGTSVMDMAAFLYLLCRRPDEAADVAMILDRGKTYVPVLAGAVASEGDLTYDVRLSDGMSEVGRILLVVTDDSERKPVLLDAKIGDRSFFGTVRGEEKPCRTAAENVNLHDII